MAETMYRSTTQDPVRSAKYSKTAYGQVLTGRLSRPKSPRLKRRSRTRRLPVHSESIQRRRNYYRRPRARTARVPSRASWRLAVVSRWVHLSRSLPAPTGH